MALEARHGVTYSGINYFGATDSDWNLVGPQGYRVYNKPVVFSTPFSVEPQFVSIAVSSFFILENGGSLKINVEPLNVTEEGFDLVISTWDDCQVVGIGCSWTAFADV